MVQPLWLTTVEFAFVADIRRQVANRLCEAFVSGRKLHWHDYALEVQTVYGRGGNRGKSYLVKVSSLPPHFQERLKALQTPVEGRSNLVTGSAAARERTWWLHVLGPALEHPKASAGRKAALTEIAGKPVLDLHSRHIRLTVRTLQRKLARMEGEGSIGPLVRSGRSDKGEKRVFLSRTWDAAVPFEDKLKADIADMVRQYIRGLIKGGGQPKEIKVLARQNLVKLTNAWGFRPNDRAMLERIGAIPKAMIHAERVFKKVYRHKFDRKASEDDRPRTKRTIKGLRPMQIVVMDVHPCDVLVARSNGTTATPRLLGFHDLATGRVWCDLVFLYERGGVRNTDIIESFTGMAMHPEFGLPETLYVDNGSEYLFADFLDDAMQLNVPAILAGKRTSRVIRALPYNAAAKPIERWFGHFEQHYLRSSRGWIGGDRMNKKQQQIGKQIAPFGPFDAFVPAFFGLLKAYEHMPHTHGENKGKSPAQVFGEHVADGWAATVMDPENLLSVFTRPETRLVRNHAISVDGRVWTGDVLDRFLGERVTVRIPAFHGFNELVVVDDAGRELGVVRPNEVFDYHDPRGAKRSASRNKSRNGAIRELDRSVPEISLHDELVAYGSAQMPIAPNAPRGTVSVPGSNQTARAIVPAGKRATDAEQREERRKILELQLMVAERVKQQRAP